MADIGDVQAFEALYRGQLDKLDAADIDDRDRQAIRKLVRRRNANGVSKGTNTGTLNRLRLAAERAPVPLVEFGDDGEDYYALHESLELDYDLSDGTLRNYRKALKRFAEFVDAPWAEEIVIGASPSDTDTIDPSMLLDDEEVTAMIDHARGERDRAIMAMLRDTGARIGALCNLRIRDVDVDDQIGEFTVRNLPGNKDVSGTRDFFWAAGYVSSYLAVHPLRTEDDAPLFTYRPPLPEAVLDGSDDGALLTSSVRRMLKRTARRADIDPSRTHPHNWRHTAHGEWKLGAMNDRQILHRGFHAEGSDELKRYGPLEDEQLNDSIRGLFGFGEDESTRTPELETCPRCSAPLRDGTNFCAQCSLALDERAAERIERFQGETADKTLTDGQDAADRETLLKLAAVADVEPAEIEALLQDG
jgi:integrase